MTSTVPVPRVDVRKDVGTLLMLRSTVAPLFRKIARFDARRVIIDFSGVEFMSRSFADEYLTAKAASQKAIEEIDMPDQVRRMIELVSKRVGSTKSPRADIRQPSTRVHAI